jgi:hypothetical protein
VSGRVGARQPVLEHDHRTDDARATEVGDVEALDAQQGLVEPERTAQVLECGAARAEVGGATHARPLQLLARVLRNGREQLAPVATLRDADAHTPRASAVRGATTLRQQLGERVGVLRLHPDQHGGRHVVVTVGVQRHETARHERSRRRPGRLLEGPTSPTDDAAGTDEEDVHGRFELLLDERDRVEVGLVEGHGLLAGRRTPRGLELIAQLRGRLVALRRRCLLHARLEVIEHGAGATSEEGCESVDQLAVTVGVDRARTGCGAAVDVVQQTRAVRATCAVEHAVAAGAHREDAQQQIEGRADVGRAHVRAEPLVALLGRRALHASTRHVLGRRDDELRIRLVVTETDVVTWPVALDQRPLEVQGCRLRVDHDPLDATCGLQHRAGALGDRVPRTEVAGETRTQRTSLAHVEDTAVLVLEQVAARQLGDAARLGPEVEGRVAHAQPARAIRAVRRAGASSDRRCVPVWLPAWAATSSGVPVTTMRPPPDPPSGPRSMT